MQTGSSGTLIGWKSGQTTFVLQWDRDRICKRLWSPGIDFEESMPLAYVAWRAGTTYTVVVPVRQAWNRFLGSFKGLQIRALNGGTVAMESEVVRHEREISNAGR
jgi:hypothetical protein